MNQLLKLVLFIMNLLIISCTTSQNKLNNNITNSTSDNVAPPQARLLAIDKVSTVPVLGDNVTQSIIYVHNNSDSDMHNIQYSVKDNHQLNTGKSAKFQKLTTKKFGITTNACQTIPAHSRCALPFSTPEIALSEAEGSAIIIADNGTEHYEQLINYQRINTHDMGVQALGNISLTGLDVDNGFVTIYAYVSSDGNYSVTYNPHGAILVAPDKLPNHIGSLQVVPIELRLNLINGYADLELDSQNNGKYHAIVQLSTTPQPNGAVLVSGATPITNLKNGATGYIIVYNAGNQTTPVGITRTPSGTITLNGGCSGVSLAPASSCTESYTITNNVTDSGSITFAYGGSSSLTVPVTWYNPTQGMLLQTSLNPQTLIVPVGSTSPAIATITNIGSTTLGSMQESAWTWSPNKQAITSISNDNCNSNSILVGGNCTFNINVAESSVIESGIIKLRVSGQYQNNGIPTTYSRSSSISYSSMNSTRYVYIVNNNTSTNTVTVCNINYVESLTNCQVALANGFFYNSHQLAIYNNKAYIINESGPVTICNLSLNSGTGTPPPPLLTDCTTENTTTSGLPSNASSEGITINNGIAYISNFSGSVWFCNINSSNGQLTGCTSVVSIPSVILSSINNNYIYFASSSMLYYSLLTNISSSHPNISTGQTKGIAFYQGSTNNYAYLSDFNNALVKFYTVDTAGLLSDNGAILSGTVQPFGLLVDNNYLFVVHSNYITQQCELSPNTGNIVSICNNYTPSPPNLFSNAVSITAYIPILSTTAFPDSITYIRGGDAVSSTITITNISAYTLTNLTESLTITGNASVNKSANNCTSLSAGQNCQVTFTLTSDSVSESGVISANITANYNTGLTTQTYNSTANVNYQSISNIYAYVTNSTTVKSGIVNPTNYTFTLNNIVTDNPPLNYVQAINTFGNYAYILNFYNPTGWTSPVGLCNINSNGTFNNCVQTGSNFTQPAGIAFYTDTSGITHAYVINRGQTSNQLTSCTVGVSGVLSNCANSTLAAIRATSDITVYGNYVYITGYDEGAVMNCPITPTTGAVSTTCQYATGYLNANGIFGYNNYMYVANRNGPTYIQYCQIMATNGTLFNCKPAGGSGFNGMGKIVSFNTQAYIANYIGGNITTCRITESGPFGTCQNTGTITAPTGISLYLAP